MTLYDNDGSLEVSCTDDDDDVMAQDQWVQDVEEDRESDALVAEAYRHIYYPFVTVWMAISNMDKGGELKYFTPQILGFTLV